MARETCDRRAAPRAPVERGGHIAPRLLDLIDGDQLCGLLKGHQLGVRTEERRVEDVKVVESFFDEIG